MLGDVGACGPDFFACFLDCASAEYCGHLCGRFPGIYIEVKEGQGPDVEGGIKLIGWANGSKTVIQRLSFRQVRVAANTNNVISFSCIQGGFPGIGCQHKSDCCYGYCEAFGVGNDVYEGGQISFPTQCAITETGVLFHYNTYEIGPYVLGDADIFLTWTDLGTAAVNPFQ